MATIGSPVLVAQLPTPANLIDSAHVEQEEIAHNFLKFFA